jgi:hypothetical protein
MAESATGLPAGRVVAAGKGRTKAAIPRRIEFLNGIMGLRCGGGGWSTASPDVFSSAFFQHIACACIPLSSDVRILPHTIGRQLRAAAQKSCKIAANSVN